MTRYLLIALALLAVAAGMGALYFRASAAVSDSRRVVAEQKVTGLEQSLSQSETARKSEHRKAVEFTAIAYQREQDKIDVQAMADRTVADLHSRNLRLRDRWATQRLANDVAASASEPDAATADRDASASRIVQAAADADSQIKGLQAVLRAERK